MPGVLRFTGVASLRGKMRSSQDEISLPEGELRRLLDVLCVQWGFCIPPETSEDISRRSSLTANEFAAAVLQAEGMNPEYEKRWFLRVRDRFIEKFGERVILDESGVKFESDVL